MTENSDSVQLKAPVSDQDSSRMTLIRSVGMLENSSSIFPPNDTGLFSAHTHSSGALSGLKL